MLWVLLLHRGGIAFLDFQTIKHQFLIMKSGLQRNDDVLKQTVSLFSLFIRTLGILGSRDIPRMMRPIKRPLTSRSLIAILMRRVYMRKARLTMTI